MDRWVAVSKSKALASMGGLVVLAFCMAHGLYSQMPSDSPSWVATHEPPVGAWLQMLKSDRYADRELAKQQLLAQGPSAVPAILAFLPEADLESASSLIYVLTEMLPEDSDASNQSALDALQELSRDRWTLAGSLASRALQSLSGRLREETVLALRSVRASIHVDSIQIVGYPTPELHLRIDDEFMGAASDLKRLRYLWDVEVVALSGDKITAAVLRQVGQMPNLKFLQLKRVRLDREILTVLQQFRPLDTLEIVYCKIEPELLPKFGEMDGLSQLALFGTGAPADSIAALRRLAPQMEVIFHGGGFLGIRSKDDSGVVIVEVVPYGAADRAGLMAGDRLTHVNRVPLSRFEDLRSELSKFVAGDKIQVTVERANIHSSSKIDMDVILGERE